MQQSHHPRRIRKVLAAGLSAATLSIGLVACASTGDGQGDSSTLTVYSNSLSDGRGEWLERQAQAEGFDIQLVDLGGADLQNRLEAEKANPIADVVFGLNNIYFENLKNQNILDSFTPSWASDVEPGLGDDEQYWPIVKEPIMLVYNDAAYAPSEAPQDWPELWQKSQYHQQYQVPTSMGGATTQMVLAGILARYLDDNGDLGVSEKGWKAIEEYFKNGLPETKGTDLYARMAASELNMGQMWLAGKEAREKEYGISTTAVHPAVGVPMATQHISVIKGTDATEKAQEFINWFGSPELQAAWSQEFFTAPTNKQALSTANQEAIEQTNSFTAQDIDWETVAQYLPQWIEKIELNYLP
ncbi:extracellular solute-binding protein [Corynebacterium lowii]|uniref:Bacterial extracellular solute-binding protein n=1 Tax=Corynebacterium lowii TaxID=1544413 RepID=A0A0Q1AJR0_9CORY|nr:extracellular solute-binding protein [Corynebacterium lowii]KQB87105.1 Bacterial extracellular solute-binding protein [Corynebacterium lowii]MDP9852309.1 iron(III) transport system substrate-binding protein [Corynebacterium lowii]